MLDLQAVLEENEIDAELIDLKVPMKTVQAAADQLDVPVAQIFKSLVLRGPSESDVVVAVLDGEARLDLKAVRKVLGWKKARFAPGDLVLAATGYPPGGTPPLGHKEDLPVLVDERLLSFEHGYAGGGRPELLLLITPQEILRATSARLAPIRQTD